MVKGLVAYGKRPLEVDAYTNPTLVPNGESPLAQFQIKVENELEEKAVAKW